MSLKNDCLTDKKYNDVVRSLAYKVGDLFWLLLTFFGTHREFQV